MGEILRPTADPLPSRECEGKVQRSQGRRPDAGFLPNGTACRYVYPPTTTLTARACMKAPIHNFYGKYCLSLIGKALQAAVGHTPNVVTDAELFTQVVIEPGWKSLPLPLRIFGREGAHWNEFLLQVRKDVFTGVGVRGLGGVATGWAGSCVWPGDS